MVPRHKDRLDPGGWRRRRAPGQSRSRCLVRLVHSCYLLGDCILLASSASSCATELAHSRCLRESSLWSLALWRALCCCWWWAGPVSPPCPGTFARCFPLCYGVHPCVDPLISFIFRAASLLAPSCSGVLPLSGCASQSKSGLQSLSTSGRSVGSSNHCLAFSEVTWVRSRCWGARLGQGLGRGRVYRLRGYRSGPRTTISLPA